jgi:hypothetical protein
VSAVYCTCWAVPCPREELARAGRLGIRGTRRRIRAGRLSHRANRRNGRDMVEFGCVLDVVIRGAVKAVKANASVGARDMLLRTSWPRGKGEEAKETSTGAETVIKMTETSNSWSHTHRDAVLTPLSGRSSDRAGQPAGYTVAVIYSRYMRASPGTRRIHCVSPLCFRLSDDNTPDKWSGSNTG